MIDLGPKSFVSVVLSLVVSGIAGMITAIIMISTLKTLIGGVCSGEDMTICLVATFFALIVSGSTFYLTRKFLRDTYDI